MIPGDAGQKIEDDKDLTANFIPSKYWSGKFADFDSSIENWGRKNEMEKNLKLKQCLP